MDAVRCGAVDFVVVVVVVEVDVVVVLGAFAVGNPEQQVDDKALVDVGLFEQKLESKLGLLDSLTARPDLSVTWIALAE